LLKDNRFKQNTDLVSEKEEACMKFAYDRLTVAIALATVGLLYLIGPTPVAAQSSQMTVSIPFEFYVGDQKLPAGDYKIMQQPGTGTSVLWILGQHVSHSAIFTTPTTNRHPNRNTSIVFNKYAGDMFLSEAHWRGADIGRKLPMSTIELDLARNITPERVVTAGKNP
jgi:hypothetical protein